MKYFVSIENNVYCRWQAELLIESFRMIGMADDLVLAVAESSSPGDGYSNNINGHPIKFEHENVGDTHGCKAINKWVGLATAEQSGLLGHEFAILHPDMMILSPITSGQQRAIRFQSQADEEPSDIRACRERLGLPEKWVGQLGDTMVFKNVPSGFPSEVVGAAITLKDEVGPEHRQRAAIMAAIASGCVDLCLMETFEQSLIHPVPGVPIIHYRHGMPPTFHKRHHRGGFSLSDNGSPLDSLLGSNPSTSSEAAQNVVRSYQKNGRLPVGATGRDQFNLH